MVCLIYFDKFDILLQNITSLEIATDKAKQLYNLPLKDGSLPWLYCTWIQLIYCIFKEYCALLSLFMLWYLNISSLSVNWGESILLLCHLTFDKIGTMDLILWILDSLLISITEIGKAVRLFAWKGCRYDFLIYNVLRNHMVLFYISSNTVIWSW